MLPLRDELPTRRTPIVTYLLIALNTVVFIWESALVEVGHSQVLMDWGVVPAELWANPIGEAHTVLSSMFMHAPGTWWHLGGNMLYLWIFGDNVEDALGRGRYLLFYLACGAVAAIAQVLIAPSSMIPMVGASGAIAGVLAAYGSLYPRSPITVLNPVLPLWLFMGPFFRMSAWLVIAIFFVLNLVSGLTTLGGDGGGVAFFAHLGGFVAGLLLVRVLLPPSQRRPPDQRRWAHPSDGRTPRHRNHPSQLPQWPRR